MWVIHDRNGLINAIANCKTTIKLSGPAAGMISADSMADALLSQLDEIADGKHRR